MILDHRVAVWAEDECIKAKGHAGFRKGFRTADNIFVKSLIDKQEHTHGNLYCCFVDFKKAFVVQFPVACCGRCWRPLAFVDQYLTTSSLCDLMTVPL